MACIFAIVQSAAELVHSTPPPTIKVTHIRYDCVKFQGAEMCDGRVLCATRWSLM